MVLQKLDIVEEDIVEPSTNAENAVNNEKSPALNTPDRSEKVIVFDNGDKENAANWSTVWTRPCKQDFPLP